MSFKTGLAGLVFGVVGCVGTAKMIADYNKYNEQIKSQVPARVWYVEDKLEEIRGSPNLANKLKDPNFVEDYRQLLMESEKNKIKQEVKEANRKIDDYSPKIGMRVLGIGSASLAVLLIGTANLLTAGLYWLKER